MGMLPPFLINNSKGEFIIVFTIIFLIFLFIFCIFFYIKWILSWSFLFIKIIQNSHLQVLQMQIAQTHVSSI